MQDITTTGAGSALDLVAALERAAELLRALAAAPAVPAAAAAAPGPVPANLGPANLAPANFVPADFANAMRRVEAEYYDAA